MKDENMSDDFRPMTDQERQLGRMVRQVWLDYCKQTNLPESHSHSAPWEELTVWEKNVDDRIGTALFRAGQEASAADLAALRAQLAEAVARADKLAVLLAQAQPYVHSDEWTALDEHDAINKLSSDIAAALAPAAGGETK